MEKKGSNRIGLATALIIIISVAVIIVAYAFFIRDPVFSGTFVWVPVRSESTWISI